MLPWIRLATRKRSGNAGEARLNVASPALPGTARRCRRAPDRAISPAQGMEDGMAHWLPIIIGLIVAIALPLGGIYYARSTKTDA
jgi:hypothetical protein